MKHNYPQLILWLDGRITELSIRMERGENCGDDLICNTLEKIRLTNIKNGVKDED